MIQATKRYLKENIDEEMSLKNWAKQDNLPLQLKNSYNFYEMILLNTKIILVEVLDSMMNLNQLQKQINQIKRVQDRPVVLIYKVLTRYRRKSLIENRISFIIEDGQMYLPFLGLNLSKAREELEPKTSYFSIAEQVSYLFFLYNKEAVVNTTEFAIRMGFNKMAASRALNRLYHLNLISYDIGGKTERSKEYSRINDPEYFKIGHSYLSSPVRRVLFTTTQPVNALTSGLHALADLSMLSAPTNPVVAIDKHQFFNQPLEIIHNTEIINDTKLFEVELWDYDPKLFSNKEHVDVASLYAALKQEKDERIQQALQEVMSTQIWYTD